MARLSTSPATPFFPVAILVSRQVDRRRIENLHLGKLPLDAFAHRMDCFTAMGETYAQLALKLGGLNS